MYYFKRFILERKVFCLYNFLFFRYTSPIQAIFFCTDNVIFYFIKRGKFSSAKMVKKCVNFYRKKGLSEFVPVREQITECQAHSQESELLIVGIISNIPPIVFILS